MGLHAQVVAEVEGIKAMSRPQQVVAVAVAMVPAVPPAGRALLATLAVTAQLKAMRVALTLTVATSLIRAVQQAEAQEASAMGAVPMGAICLLANGA